MQLGLASDLDGTAVLYMQEADGLIDDAGHFRLDLPVAELAHILRIPSSELTGEDGRIDPDAVLFRAKAATLTTEAKAKSREIRKRQVAQGRNPDGVYGEWIVRDHAFTLNRLISPVGEEKIVLEAIVRAKLAVMPKPGDGIRAVSAPRGQLEQDEILFCAGMLPVAEAGK
ncbi:MAG TPA: hypothetical protein VEJ84_10760 [Acidimicrobiales bacterium]|nr:hypothetical protein [Acidimicrobiales bacterium]